jgi:hypothetical protein
MTLGTSSQMPARESAAGMDWARHTYDMPLEWRGVPYETHPHTVTLRAYGTRRLVCTYYLDSEQAAKACVRHFREAHSYTVTRGMITRYGRNGT